MSDLKTAATQLVKALDTAAKAVEKYISTAKVIGLESGDATARGMDIKQLRRRVQAEVIARLSPAGHWVERGGVPTRVDAPLQINGAPEARRYCAAHPLPGL